MSLKSIPTVTVWEVPAVRALILTSELILIPDWSCGEPVLIPLSVESPQFWNVTSMATIFEEVM